MAHGAKGRDEKINVLRAPTHLRHGKDRQEEQRRADVKDQVPPAVQDPQALAFARPPAQRAQFGDVKTR